MYAAKLRKPLLNLFIFIYLNLPVFIDRPVQELMDPGRWQQLVLQFRADNFKLHQLSTNSVFYVVLQAGLSALKTPYPLLIYYR